MNFQLSTSFLCVQWLLFLVLLNMSPSLALHRTDPELHHACNSQFSCGEIAVGYPFSGGIRPSSCGHPDLMLTCSYGSYTTITIKGTDYRVLKIDERAQTLTIVRQEIYDTLHFCTLDPFDSQPVNTTIDHEVFYYSAGYEDLTISYDCSFSATHPGRVACEGYNTSLYKNVFLQTGANVSGACDFSITVPVATKLIRAAKGNLSLLEEAVYNGFELKWEISSRECAACRNSSGSCGFDREIIFPTSASNREFIFPTPASNKEFIFPTPASKMVCYCPNWPNLDYDSTSVCANSSHAIQTPPPSVNSGPTTKVLVGMLIILSIILISGAARKLIRDGNYSKRKETIQNIEAFVRNFGSLVPQRFQYYDIKKMTKSFSNKLGQGGYGDVYQGKLADGRLVAVKLLKESKGNGEEFINEVASICRTSHVNIVALLGFCYSRNKRALVYEFMPNGSLDKFIYDKESSSTNHNLEWKVRYQIAIGIARGLEYLHRGCNTRIVHFDIKPHNILLDVDFRPKISDFGLAKLCKEKESILSMLGARGTAGYIAPEIFCRTFGEVSHKSDVYSYGMMILEMVGGRKNIDAIVSHTSEIYFPNWIYKQLEPGKDFEFHGVVTEEEKEMAKKMIIVSMWCIQTIPSNRPSMGKVMEMLEGSLESLQVPPKPSLTVPARSPKHSIPLSSFSTSTSSHTPTSQEEEICIDLSTSDM